MIAMANSDAFDVFDVDESVPLFSDAIHVPHKCDGEYRALDPWSREDVKV